ncbi:MAG: AAA family ATPase [Fimbriimonadaceae bacterium]
MPDSESYEILDRIADQVPAENAKLTSYVSALRDSMDKDEVRQSEREKELAAYQEAYEKLTAPANRIGVFLGWAEENSLAHISVGDTEFVASVDPNVEFEKLMPGHRIRVNEAYAIVGFAAISENGPLHRVSEILADGRVRIGSETPGGESRIILIGGTVDPLVIRANDEIRLDSSGKFAIEHFPKQETRDYFFEDIPEIPWQNIGGQEKAIALIRETIEYPLLHPELFAQYDKKPIKGMLLYGPPGCGKTLIGKATAYNLTKEYSEQVGHEVKEYFMHISGPKILNMWLGETERMVREIFATARAKAKEGRLVFIFMDEAEAVLRTRSSGKWMNISNTVVPQFCAELDGLVSLDNVVLMLTSNRPDYIDPAILRPERIDRKIKIERPNRAAAQQILGIYLHANLPLDPALVKKYQGETDCARKELVEGAIQALWAESKETEFLKVSLRNGSSKTLYWRDLVSGALIKSVVDRAKDLAIKRAIANTKDAHGILLSDLEESIRAEYSENEIFPKNDIQDDWLRLLDLEPESVVSVKPVGVGKGEKMARRSII